MITPRVEGHVGMGFSWDARFSPETWSEIVISKFYGETISTSTITGFKVLHPEAMGKLVMKGVIIDGV